MQYLFLYTTDNSTPLFKLQAYVIFFTLSVPLPVLGSIYLFFGEDVDIERIADNGFVLAEIATCVFKFFPFIKYSQEIRDCIHYLEAPNFLPVMEKHLRIINKCINICRRNTKIFLTLCSSAFVLFGIRPLLISGYKLPFDVWLPQELSKKMSIFCSVYFYVILGVGYPAFASAVVDPLIGGLPCLAVGQIRILQDNLEFLEEYTTQRHCKPEQNSLGTTESNSSVMYQLICKCVQHHKAILDFVKIYEKYFSPIVFSQLIGSTFTLGFCCLQLIMLNPVNYPMSFIQTVICLCVLLVQIYFYCYYGTILYEESDALTKAVYMGNWYNYDIKSKKALIILMERSKRPMKFTAGKIIDVSLETFATILKRSYSLLAVLKNQ